jgi:hypothetical protein
MKKYPKIIRTYAECESKGRGGRTPRLNRIDLSYSGFTPSHNNKILSDNPASVVIGTHFQISVKIVPALGKSEKSGDVPEEVLHYDPGRMVEKLPIKCYSGRLANQICPID